MARSADISTSACTPPGVLSLTCEDRPGIVAAVGNTLATHGRNIVDSQQYSDPQTGRFFMRLEVEAISGATPSHADVRRAFATTAAHFGMQWQWAEPGTRDRVVVMVSNLGHCLNALLYQWNSGALAGDIVAVVSNHQTFRSLVEWYGVPYHFIPVSPDTKPAAEQALRSLLAEYDCDLLVLARYMQILSDGLCQDLTGSAINIHHSFLPSFKGAKPYAQAHERGVKLIGATAHYVTPALDEGPIIEQDVARIDHRQQPEQLAAIGRDVEAATLSRAVQWHLQRRVVLNGNRTVVFR